MLTEGLKGQSAIEYLMTYGWMLLVVAIVGGAIFSIVGDQSIENVSGFTGGDVAVENFGLTTEGMGFVVRNTNSESVEIDSVRVFDGNDEVVLRDPPEIEVADSESFVVCGVSEESGSNSLDVEIVYDTDSFSDLSVSGSVSGSLVVDENVSTEFGFSCPSFSEPEDLSSVLSGMDGSGTESDPYIVENDYHLQAIDSAPKSNFTLGSDINVSGTQEWNGGRGFDPINSFSGKLHGEDHVIMGLNINRSTNSNNGLIADLRNNGELHNLYFNSSRIEGDSQSSVVVGTNRGKIEDIVVMNSNIEGKDGRVGFIAGFQHGGGSVNRTGAVGQIVDTGGSEIGGIVGYNTGGTIDNSYYHGNVTHDTNFQIGGITGVNRNNGVVKNSFSSININGNTGFQVEGLIGDKRSGTASDLYLDVGSSNQNTGNGQELSTDEMTGGNARGNMTGLDFQNTWRTVDEDYPKLR